jgi:hypothetical protein
MNDHATGLLGQWYVTPMDTTEATAMLQAAGSRHADGLRRGHSSLCCRLRMMQARYWLNQDIRQDFEQLQHAVSGSRHAQALLELLYGQLLISRRLHGANEHLLQGFVIARDLFNAADYFRVLKRHQLLARLPLSHTPARPETLSQLLATARVIEQFQQRQSVRLPRPSDHKDTHG